MLEMIGVGPFITLPLVIAAAGYGRLSVWAWVLGAVIAVADGLVWAELGAAFPRAGGSYAFLARDLRPEGRGQLAELSLRLAGELFRAAVDCFGLHRAVEFLAWFWPGLDGRRLPRCRRCTTRTLPPPGACLLVTALLYRNLRLVTRLAWVLFAGVLAAIAGVIVSGFAHAAATGGWQMPASPPLSALTLALGGLAQGTLLRHLLLLGLLQHLLSGRRGAAAGADDSARHSALGAVRFRRFMWP
jgi:amino acid transporter